MVNYRQDHRSTFTIKIMNKDTETAWTPKATIVKPLRPLTLKRKSFTKHLATDKRTTITQAAIDAGYSPKTAYSIGSELLKKPEIQTELAKYEGKAEYNLMVLADKSTEYALTGTDVGSKYASVSERTNNSIIDRLRGKATQKTESVSTTVTLSLSLKDITDTDISLNPPTIPENK